MAHVNDRYYRQYLIAIIGSLAIFSTTAAFAWTARIMRDGKLKRIRYSDSETLWMSLLFMLGRFVTIVPAAWAMDRFGRKRTAILGVFPLLIGWMIVIMTPDVAAIYVFKVLAGLSGGVVLAAVMPIYLGEIASDPIRGSVCCLHGAMATAGVCFTYALTPYISYHLLNYLMLVPAVTFVLTFGWCPESPYWLLAHDRQESAREALVLLRGHPDVADEFDVMRENVALMRENPIPFKEMANANNRRGLVVVFGLSVFIVMSGTEAALTFSQNVFKRLNAPITGDLLNVITGVLLLLATTVVAGLVDHAGRRPLLLASAVGMFGGNVIVAVYFVMRLLEVNVTASIWIPMCAFVIFVVSYSFGVATVSFVLIGELLHADLKRPASALFGLTVALLGLMVIMLFRWLSEAVGFFLLYAMFALFSAILFPFVWFYVPETKRKPLREILAIMEQTS